MNTMPSFKRVVTKNNSRGLSVICHEAGDHMQFPLQAVPGTLFHEIWRTDASPAQINNKLLPSDLPLKLTPEKNGTVLRVVDIPPDADHQSSSNNLGAAFSEMGASAAYTSNVTSKHNLMHRTETVDYGIVLEGEVWLILDDEEVHLQRGDVVIQRGTNHAWSNRTESMARMVFILIDGQYAV